MDAYGYPGPGGAVVLNDCNDVDAQKWIYDGRNLRPKYNTGLCLNIQDGNALLIVSPCNNGSSSAWVEYSISMVFGASRNMFNHYLCPVGSKVINISGHAGNVVDRLYMTCDDGSNTVLGPAGGDDENPSTSPNCSRGYGSLSVKMSGMYLGSVVAKCSGSPSLEASIGGAIDEGSDSIMSLVLQSDQRVIGMQVYSGGDVSDAISIAIIYSSTSGWPQTVSPMVFPTVVPTVRPSVQPTAQPTAHPTVQPTVLPTVSPTVHPTIQPTVLPTKKRVPSKRPSKRPARPSMRPSKKPSARPSKRITKAPSKRITKRPSKKPSKRPTIKTQSGRRVKVVESYSSTDLLTNLIWNMSVSDHGHDGRHLRSTNTSYNHLFSDVRISDIVISSRDSSLSSSSTSGQEEHDNNDENIIKWQLLGTNLNVNRFSSYRRNLVNRDMTISGENLDHIKDEIGKQVSHEVKKEMATMKNEMSNVKDEMMKMKNEVSAIIKEEVMKKNKPLEDKLDRISRLLERVLAM